MAPMSASWFDFRGRLHALNPEKDRPTSYCGLSPLDVASVQTMDNSAMPDGACDRCLVEVATDSTSDEPLAHAQARGYVDLDKNL